MEQRKENPFVITKSVDFTDEEIKSYWVDITAEGGFVSVLKPRSPMPMFILGGKGSGKTHVMRYMSFPVQKIRYGARVLDAIREDGYIGLYMRCGGLNSSRFQKKGFSEEQWNDVFAYQFEIWLAQIVIGITKELCRFAGASEKTESAIASQTYDLFDIRPQEHGLGIDGVTHLLGEYQRELNIAVNNVALAKRLELHIPTSPGSLVFGLPKIVVSELPELMGVSFLYLIDEFENLMEYQQVHINTLLREREPPCSFRVGGRLYGVKTQLTNSGNEENKEDSEFEKIILDDLLRRNPQQYSQFAKRLVVKRLVEASVLAAPLQNDEQIDTFLAGSLCSFACDGLMEAETAFIKDKFRSREKPWQTRLRNVLRQGAGRAGCIGVSAAAEIDEIVALLACSEYPILEKLNCFIFYQRARPGRQKHLLVDIARGIGEECAQFALSLDRSSPYGSAFQHYRLDMLAQLLRESERDLVYAGAETFVDISWGIPRNLLVLFKNVYEWAVFKGERPFSTTPISLSAQVAGVQEAANWFFRDSRMTGRDGRLVLDSIHRLGELFREIRYSDKPSECELTTFSFNASVASDEATRIIQLAIDYSLLVETSKQSDRNSQRIDRKLQLSRMIAPRWELGLNSRGAIALSANEIEAIFTGAGQDKFFEVVRERVGRMTAPCFEGATRSDGGPTLFDGLLDG